MICSFNWGLDKIVDAATGYFYPASGTGAVTAACAGATSPTDTINTEADYENDTLTQACGGTRCTKLNDLICKMNWAMVKLDRYVVGKYLNAGTTDERACYSDVSTPALNSGTPITTGHSCSNDTCTKLNKILCYYLLKSSQD